MWRASSSVCLPTSSNYYDVTGLTSMWRTVNPTEYLMAAVYLYNVNALVSLTKMSHRTAKSTTTTSGDASTMKRYVFARDRRRCWVSRSIHPNTNSHVCPVRIGDQIHIGQRDHQGVRYGHVLALEVLVIYPSLVLFST